LGFAEIVLQTSLPQKWAPLPYQDSWRIKESKWNLYTTV